MRVGPLRHRVTIQQACEEQAASGAVTIEWKDVVHRWAQVQPVTGREIISGQQVRAEISHRVWMRYQPGIVITPKERLMFGDRVFNILSIINRNEKDRELELLCTEVLPVRECQ